MNVNVNVNVDEATVRLAYDMLTSASLRALFRDMWGTWHARLGLGVALVLSALACTRSSSGSPSEADGGLGRRDADVDGTRDAGQADGSSAVPPSDPPGRVPPDPPDASADAADPGPDLPDSGVAPEDEDAGTEHDAGPPRLTLIAPGRAEPGVAEVYRGLPASLHARCEPGRWTRVERLSWSLDGAPLAEIAARELRAEHRFEQPGSYTAEAVCSDSRGQSSRAQLRVEVRSEPPYVVYHDPLQLRAARVDRLDRSEVIEPERPLVAPPVGEAHYARGGKAVVTVARSERRNLEQAFAIYLDDPAQPRRFELGRYESSPGWGLHAHVSPDGRHALVNEPDRAPHVFLLDDAGPVEIAVPELGPWQRVDEPVSFTADGRYLLYAAGGPLQLSDLQTGVTVTLAAAPQSLQPAYWRDARFLDGGERVVYRLLDADGTAHVYVISLDGALSGGEADEVAIVPGFEWLSEVTERTLLIGASDPLHGPLTYTVLDLAGQLLASYPLVELRAVCGDRVLRELADGAIELVQHAPAVLRGALAELSDPMEELAWSRDCRTVVARRDLELSYFELPPEGLPGTPPVVHRVSGQSLWRIADSDTGAWIVTFDSQADDPGLQLNRGGVAAARLPGIPDFWLTPDGASAIWMPYVDPGAPTSVVHRTLLTGVNAGASERLHGPFESLEIPQLAPDSRSLLLLARPGLGPDGELIGDGGLVRVDLNAPSGPGSGALLPYGRIYSEDVRAERAAGRTLLLHVPAERPGVLSVHARSLEDGAQTVAQVLGGPPREFTHGEALSEDGRAFAAERELQGEHRFARTIIRTRASDPVELRTRAALAGEHLAGFGAHADELLLQQGRFDDERGVDILARHDLVTAQSRVVAQAPDESVSITHVQRYRDGRVFFRMGASGRVALYVDEPGNAAPRALTALDRTLGEVWIAPHGDWLALYLEPRSYTAEDAETIQVLDARRDWQPAPLPLIPEVANAADVTFASGEPDRLLLLPLTYDRPHQLYARDALDSPYTFPPMPFVGPLVSSDQSRAITMHHVLAPFSPSLMIEWLHVWTLELGSPVPDVELRLRLPGRGGYPSAISASGRFIVMVAEASVATLLDLDAGTSHALPERTAGWHFDRLNRYLMFSDAYPASSCDIHILDLDALDQPARTIARGCPAAAPLWVD